MPPPSSYFTLEPPCAVCCGVATLCPPGRWKTETGDSRSMFPHLFSQAAASLSRCSRCWFKHRFKHLFFLASFFKHFLFLLHLSYNRQHQLFWRLGCYFHQHPLGFLLVITTHTSRDITQRWFPVLQPRPCPSVNIRLLALSLVWLFSRSNTSFFCPNHSQVWIMTQAIYWAK